MQCPECNSCNRFTSQATELHRELEPHSKIPSHRPPSGQKEELHRNILEGEKLCTVFMMLWSIKHKRKRSKTRMLTGDHFISHIHRLILPTFRRKCDVSFVPVTFVARGKAPAHYQRTNRERQDNRLKTAQGQSQRSRMYSQTNPSVPL